MMEIPVILMDVQTPVWKHTVEMEPYKLQMHKDKMSYVMMEIKIIMTDVTIVVNQILFVVMA